MVRGIFNGIILSLKLIFIVYYICFELYFRFIFFIVLQVNENDILPKRLCQQCLADITYIYEFINKYRESEEILQASLKSSENAIEYNEDKNEITLEEQDLSEEIEDNIKIGDIKEECDLVHIDEEDKNPNVYPEC